MPIIYNHNQYKIKLSNEKKTDDFFPITKNQNQSKLSVNKIYEEFYENLHIYITV